MALLAAATPLPAVALRPVVLAVLRRVAHLAAMAALRRVPLAASAVLLAWVAPQVLLALVRNLSAPLALAKARHHPRRRATSG